MTGSYLSSTADGAPYTFDSTGDIFQFTDDLVFDQTLRNILLYNDNPNALGEITTDTNGGANVECSIGVQGSGPQQACPLNCNGNYVNAIYDCNGDWYAYDIGDCTTFQPYAISQ